MPYNFRERFNELGLGVHWPSWPSQMPFVDFHRLNLDWILEAMRAVLDQMKYYFIDGGSKETIEEVIEEHPEWVTTVMDGAITTPKLANEAVTPAKMANFSTNYKSNAGIVEQLNTLDSNLNINTLGKSGGLAGALAEPQLLTYYGNREVINETINLDNISTGIYFKTISGTQFVLNTDMFTWTADHKQLPTFVNCIFYGNGGNIVADGLYVSTAKFINCVFVDAPLIENGEYAQTCQFIGCRFSGTKTVISAASAGDVKFTQCQGESDFKGKLVETAATDGSLNVALFNSVFESNQQSKLIVAAGSAKIDIIGGDYENNTTGLIDCSGGAAGSTVNIYIDNASMWQNGNPVITIDPNYTGYTSLNVKNTNIGGYTQAALVNRNDLDYYNYDNLRAEGVISHAYASPNISRALTFASNNNAIQASTTLEPGIYLAIQARVIYTGCIMYMVVYDGNNIVWQKITDDNNRWTLTDNGGGSLTITSTGYGEGAIIKIR